MESSEVYRKRLETLADRKADVEAQRDALERERAARIQAGQDTGDLYGRLSNCQSEIHALTREAVEVQNLASDAWASERTFLDREEFTEGNRSLTAKRGSLPRMQQDAIAAVAKAAGKLREFIRELDELEREQRRKAAELNRSALALGFPAEYTVPDGKTYTGQAYSRPDAATFAISRVMQTARAGTGRDLLIALAEAAASTR